jgi:hypothetical protein
MYNPADPGYHSGMIVAGEYHWRENDRYGSNHRVLKLLGSGAKIDAFSFSEIHSAGPQGKDWSLTTGTVAWVDPRRLELVSKERESFTDDGESWSRKVEVHQRRVFVAEKKWWWRRPAFHLDGEPYLFVPSPR